MSRFMGVARNKSWLGVVRGRPCDVDISAVVDGSAISLTLRTSQTSPRPMHSQFDTSIRLNPPPPSRWFPPVPPHPSPQELSAWSWIQFGSFGVSLFPLFLTIARFLPRSSFLTHQLILRRTPGLQTVHPFPTPFDTINRLCGSCLWSPPPTIYNTINDTQRQPPRGTPILSLLPLTS